MRIASLLLLVAVLGTGPAVAWRFHAAATGGSRILTAGRATSINADLFSDLSWRCIGPFDGGPVASVVGGIGEPGVYQFTTPNRFVGRTVDGGDTWTLIEQQDIPPPSGDPHRWTDPANPRRIARTDAQGISVSLDGGQTWRALHNQPIAEVARIMPRARQAEPAGKRVIAGKTAAVSVADPSRAGLVFAAVNDSVYVSFDDGARWQSLRLNMPAVTINDLDLRDNALIVATQGWSMWQFDDISPLRQITAASASAPAILFKPADHIDYYLGPATRGDVTLEISNATGHVVHVATSAAPDPADRWLPVMRPLSAAPGHHRVTWNLRLDPPPAQKHSFAQMARAVFEELPPDPDGPRVLAGTYRVKLTVAGQSYSQPLVVRNDPRATPVTLAAERREFDLAMKIYDAMRIAHDAFMQLARARGRLEPFLTSADADVAAMATDLDTRLVQLDGSDWTGLIIPDEDQDEFDPDEAEEQGLKHPDFIPPTPVSVSKDYDDPTSILGRRFESVSHAPAFATLSADLGTMLTKVMTTPDAVTGADYDRSCRLLSGVLDAWRAINAQDLARVNAELTAKKLAALPVAATVPAIVCR